MEDNWWGTTVEEAVEAKIHDFFDDATKGVVDYTPFLAGPNTGAPVSTPLGVEAVSSRDEGTIRVSWRPSPEADISSYWVYYDTDAPGFPYDGQGLAEGDSPIEAASGQVTLSGVEEGVTHFIAIRASDSDGNMSWFSAEVLSGWAVLEALNVKRAMACAPVIVLTGWADDEVHDTVRQMGAFDTLIKPFGVDELLLAIEDALKGGRL